MATFWDRLKQLTGGNKAPQPKQAPVLDLNKMTGSGLQVSSPNSALTYTDGSAASVQPVRTNVLGASTSAYSSNTPSYSYYSGGSSGGGGGGTAPAPTQTPNYRNDVMSKLQQLQSVYDALFGDVDKVVQEKAGEINTNYDTQMDDLSKSFQKTSELQDQQYAARGLSNSSYKTNAQEEAGNIYSRGIEEILTGKSANQAQLGQFAAGAKASFGGVLDNFRKFTDPNYLAQLSDADLMSLQSSLQGAISQGEQQKAGLRTNQEFIGELNKISPVQNAGTAQLANKLQTLVTSSAPIYAKKRIAQGLIKSAQLTSKDEQDYWNNYFSGLLTQNGA